MKLVKSTLIYYSKRYNRLTIDGMLNKSYMKAEWRSIRGGMQ
jgi:hypothetical protein